MLDTSKQDYNISLNDFFSANKELGVNIVYVNITSLRKNVNSLLTEINLIKSKLDFIILSEVWIGSDEIHLYNIPGYQLFASCNDKYRSGGVVCYVLSNIQVDKVEMDLVTADLLSLKVTCLGYFFRLVCLYRLQEYTERDFIDDLINILPLLNNDTIYIYI